MKLVSKMYTASTKKDKIKNKDNTKSEDDMQNEDDIKNYQETPRLNPNFHFLI